MKFKKLAWIRRKLLSWKIARDHQHVCRLEWVREGSRLIPFPGHLERQSHILNAIFSPVDKRKLTLGLKALSHSLKIFFQKCGMTLRGCGLIPNKTKHVEVISLKEIFQIIACWKTGFTLLKYFQYINYTEPSPLQHCRHFDTLTHYTHSSTFLLAFESKCNLNLRHSGKTAVIIISLTASG